MFITCTTSPRPLMKARQQMNTMLLYHTSQPIKNRTVVHQDVHQTRVLSITGKADHVHQVWVFQTVRVKDADIKKQNNHYNFTEPTHVLQADINTSNCYSSPPRIK
jgi:hypothetical protein